MEVKGIMKQNSLYQRGLRIYYIINYRGIQRHFRYCDSCNIYRPQRTIHCYGCNNCILELDHHCRWLGTCVGIRNYMYDITVFIISSLSLVLQIFRSFYFITVALYDIRNNKLYLRNSVCSKKPKIFVSRSQLKESSYTNIDILQLCCKIN